MKRKLRLLILAAWGLLLLSQRLRAQGAEAQQLLLDYRKLKELRNMLQDLYSGYALVQNRLQDIGNLAMGNFGRQQQFLNGLLRVDPALRQYSRVSGSLGLQLALLREYRNSYARFRSDPAFSTQELGYIRRVYLNLLQGGLGDLDDLMNLLTSGTLRMSSGQRLAAIDRIYGNMQDRLGRLLVFEQRCRLLSLQRKKEEADLSVLGQVEGAGP